MSSSRPVASNGHGAPRGVESEEVVAKALQSPSGEVFDGSAFGLGNYSEQLYWQQVRGFRKAFACYQMFGAELRERAVVETQRRMARQGHKSLDHNDELVRHKPFEELSEKRKAASKWAETDEDTYTLAEYGAHIWDDLDNPDADGLSKLQEKAMQEHAGVSDRFVSIFESLEDMRHEGSRSKGARLLDNALTAAQTLRDDRTPREDI